MFSLSSPLVGSSVSPRPHPVQEGPTRRDGPWEGLRSVDSSVESSPWGDVRDETLLSARESTRGGLGGEAEERSGLLRGASTTDCGRSGWGPSSCRTVGRLVCRSDGRTPAAVAEDLTLGESRVLSTSRRQSDRRKPLTRLGRGSGRRVTALKGSRKGPRGKHLCS